MAFYNLSKPERDQMVEKINQDIHRDLSQGSIENINTYFSDEDTYIRKIGYLALGKIFYAQSQLQPVIFSVLKQLLQSDDELIRQTVINAAGEIGKFHFDKIEHFMAEGLFDKHHRVRNAVIGSMKKNGREESRFYFRMG